MGLSNQERTDTLRRLAIGYQIDRARPLAALREGANYVPGRGPLSPPAAFIGEAPGAAEDRLRRPFCGPSGRMLDELLASVGMTRGSVYVTNVVKYRPPNNRDPLPSEKHHSISYLRRELTAVAPKCLVTLGRHALEALDPTLRLSQVHGRWQTVSGWPPVLPLYHPAVALYRSSMKPTLLADIAQLKEVPDA